MPRIWDEVLDSIIYLYPSAEEAEKGEAAGGSGFLVSLPGQKYEKYWWLYGVTNRHVIEEGASPVIRLNARQGSHEVFPLAVNNWLFHREGDDLAVALLGGINLESVKTLSISSKVFITREVVDALDIGPGDDVYMVGRFALHEGKTRNKPTVRSGIISLMPDPDDKIEVFEDGPQQEAFLVEMRSLSGYSGSPVVFQFPPLSTEWRERYRKMKPEGLKLSVGPWLLGIDCGSFKFPEKVFEVERQKGGKKVYNKTKLEAQSHSGFSAVIPAWRLLEFLNTEELVEMRKKGEETVEQAKLRSSFVPDVIRPEEDEGVLTSEDFEEAMRRASRKTSKAEEDKGEM